MSAGRGLRPAYNRDCPRIGADGLSLGLAACRETALAQTAARQHARQQDRLLGSLVLRSAEVVAELGASAHILSGTPEAVGFPDTSDMRQTVAVADTAHALAEKRLTCSSKPP